MLSVPHPVCAVPKGERGVGDARGVLDLGIVPKIVPRYALRSRDLPGERVGDSDALQAGANQGFRKAARTRAEEVVKHPDGPFARSAERFKRQSCDSG